MPRMKESTSLNSRTAREGLKPRAKPYWLVLEKGRALGYRRGLKGGARIARYYNPAGTPPRIYQSLGATDDTSDADSGMVLSFARAQAESRSSTICEWCGAPGTKFGNGWILTLC